MIKQWGVYMIEIMGTDNKNKHLLLCYYCLSQEGSNCDPQVLCSLSRQLHGLTACFSLPCFLLIFQEQHGRQMKHSASRNHVQAPCFPRDDATRWVHRIGTHGDSLLPMHHKYGHILMVQSSSDTKRWSEGCSISLALKKSGLWCMVAREINFLFFLFFLQKRCMQNKIKISYWNCGFQPLDLNKHIQIFLL